MGPIDAQLESLVCPVALSTYFTRHDETRITIQCHDRTFKKITVTDDSTGQPLLTVESKGAKSLSWRRTILDPSGHPLFDFRHFGYAMKNYWAVEDRQGQRVCSIKHVTWLNTTRSALDAIVHCNVADPASKDILVEVRPLDRSAITTMVNIRGADVAEIRLVADNDVMDLEGKGLDRTVWKARVVGGMDLVLVSIFTDYVIDFRFDWCFRFWLWFFVGLR